MTKHIRLHIEQGEHGIQWNSDEPNSFWLDIKEPGQKRDELTRAVVNRGVLIDLRDIIDRAIKETDVQRFPKSTPTKGLDHGH